MARRLTSRPGPVMQRRDAAAPSGASPLLVRRSVERRPVVLTAAIALLVAVLMAARAVDRPAAGLAVLAAIPVMLLGLELGLRGGLAAAGLSTVLVVAVDAPGHPEVGAPGVATRAAVLLALGMVTGRFSDRMRAVRRREDSLIRSGLTMGSSATEANVALAAATAVMRMPAVAGARVKIGAARPVERGDRSGPSTGVPIDMGGNPTGRIAVFHRRPLPVEDRAALTLLGTQCGLAVGSLRLHARERERAAVEAELERVREQLLGERSAIGRMRGAQEAERRRIADALQEQLAQVLAAVLIGLRLLQRAEPGRGVVSLDVLHAQVADVLGELRALAGTLRPASVQYLGLEAALRSLAAEAGGGRVTVETTGDVASLPESVTTDVYRVVEQAIAATADAPLGVSLAVTVDGAVVALRIALEARATGALDAIRSGAALAGGVLDEDVLADGRAMLVVRLRAGTAPSASVVLPRAPSALCG